jgi:ABC-type Zn2+ transport system substrate-binding protein/surface adhesin
MSMTLELVTARIAVLEEKMNLVIKVIEIDENTTKKDSKKDTKEKKTKKTKKDDSDDEKPKTKRVSGYILYSNANRTSAKEKLAEGLGEEKPKNTEVMKELARMWKELSDDEKEVWNDKAREAKQAATEVA